MNTGAHVSCYNLHKTNICFGITTCSVTLFTPTANLPVFLHRYISHICDISQLSQVLPPLKNSEISSKSFAPASAAQQSNHRPSLLKPWPSKARLPKSLLPHSPPCQSAAGSNSLNRATGPSILPSKLVNMSSAVDVSCTPPMKYREFRDFKEFIKQEKYKGTSNTHSLTEAISKQDHTLTGQSRSFGTNQFLERRILITKQLAEQQRVDLDPASMQSKGSSHEMDRAILRVQDRSFKGEKQGVLCAKMGDSPGSVLGGVNKIQDGFLGDHHKGDGVLSKRRPDKTTISDESQEENVILSERVKAVASRAGNDEQSAATNKQLAPPKICLRKFGNKQVSLDFVYPNHLNLCRNSAPF